MNHGMMLVLVLVWARLVKMMRVHEVRLLVLWWLIDGGYLSGGASQLHRLMVLVKMMLVRMNSTMMLVVMVVVGMRMMVRVMWRERSLLLPLLDCSISVGIGCTCMIRIR